MIAPPIAVPPAPTFTPMKPRILYTNPSITELEVRYAAYQHLLPNEGEIRERRHGWLGLGTT